MAEQPLVLVRVSEYGPATLTEIADVVAPVLHRYVPLPTAVKLTIGLAQVNVALPGLMFTVGRELSWKT